MKNDHALVCETRPKRSMTYENLSDRRRRERAHRHQDLQELDPSIAISTFFDPDITTDAIAGNARLMRSTQVAYLSGADPKTFDLVMIGSPTCFHLNQLKDARRFVRTRLVLRAG